MFPHPLLDEIFTSKTVVDGEGQSIPLQAQITPDNVQGLYNAVVQESPTAVVEVGMAYGISSLTILAALDKAGSGGTLVSIDPYQTTNWKSGGLKTVERAGFADRHTLIEDVSYLALPRLIEQAKKFDLAYIDGYHSFDYVLVDFFMIDLLLRVGGVVGFNDCGMRSVFKAIRFVQTHKKYEELDVGIKPNYQGRNVLITLGRRVTGRKRNDRYFRKLADYKTPTKFYARF